MYPSHWEADVVMSDGATAHLRPIRPDDAERMISFYARVSDESKYNRFFTPYPTLSARDVKHFTEVDHTDRVALILLEGDDMIAVGRYERLDGSEAEVAFLVEDAHQGRGVGSVLLEHLAQTARENGIGRFVADVLPSNERMKSVFADAGYTVGNRFDDGVLHVEFEIRPTEHSLDVMTAREHHAEARSIKRLLTPSSVAVVGASRHRKTIGQALVRNLVDGGFTGPVYAVNPAATAIAGVPAYPSVRDIPGPVDLAVVAVPAEAVEEVVLECAAAGVKGLVVVSSGFAESGSEGRERQYGLVRLARSRGMRVVGPNCLGVINTDPEVSLNASVAGTVPQPGRIAFFCQSGALGTAILSEVTRRGLGLSTFVSAGNRADVSGNDLLQYWEDDPGTDVVLLYLESLGNPRKFSRLARRVSAVKPIVAVRSGRSTQGVPLGHTVRRTAVPVEALDEMLRRSGVIQVDTLAEMFDVTQTLAYQPLPRGRRVRIVGNSDSIALLALEAAAAADLQMAGDAHDLGPGASAADYEEALTAILADPEVDSVIAVFVPTLESSADEEVARTLAAAAAGSDKPLVTTFLGSGGIPEGLRLLDGRGSPARGSIPSYPSPEEAARALGHVTDYALWRGADHGQVPALDGIDVATARSVVRTVLEEHPEGAELARPALGELLAAYGISAPETVAAAPVDEAGLVVQPMAPSGVPVAIRAEEDELFGPFVSFGVSGVPTDLLRDHSCRMPPLTDVDAEQMMRDIRAAPLLTGYQGGEPADRAAIADLIHRVARLIDDLPEVVAVELDPVLVAPSGLSVVNASVRAGPSRMRADWYVRRLS